MIASLIAQAVGSDSTELLITTVTEKGPVVAFLVAAVLYFKKRSEDAEKRILQEMENVQKKMHDCDVERSDLRHDLQALMQWVMDVHLNGKTPTVPNFRIISMSLEDRRKNQ